MSALRTAKRLMSFLSLVLVSVFILSTEAQAVMFGFENISNNDVLDAATGEAQLSVDVTDPGSNNVLFTFSNVGPLASSITDIYFDDGPLLGIASIDNSDPGVSFLQLASPPELPGANTVVPPFVTTVGFLADSDAPPVANGVNPGETVGIVFDIGSKTFADVINAINVGFDPSNYTGSGIHDGWIEPSLRIGIHVQGFDGGGSEGFIMTPIPASVVLGMLGLGVAGLKLRKFA